MNQYDVNETNILNRYNFCYDVKQTITQAHTVTVRVKMYPFSRSIF